MTWSLGAATWGGTPTPNAVPAYGGGGDKSPWGFNPFSDIARAATNTVSDLYHGTTQMAQGIGQMFGEPLYHAGGAAVDLATGNVPAAGRQAALAGQSVGNDLIGYENMVASGLNTVPGFKDIAGGFEQEFNRLYAGAGKGIFKYASDLVTPEMRAQLAGPADAQGMHEGAVDPDYFQNIKTQGFTGATVGLLATAAPFFGFGGNVAGGAASSLDAAAADASGDMAGALNEGPAYAGMKPMKLLR